MHSSEQEVGLRFRIIYYPFMGTDVDPERLLLMARLCYKPLGTDNLYDMVWGSDAAAGAGDQAVGKFVRTLSLQ